ncbi:hypothetical protein Q2V57_22250 [Enterobacter bugandensis]|uniref:hypothetical protein n=1 Tax=Enterobacter TaxID=547 RepID=UPI0018889A3A|nr:MULTISPECIES: hypothetical protein [Enterobacter]HBU6133626.1 hypothetical protein [Enterobacter cloacae]MBF2750890.1 hypothetical protein [Enterobacter bugandensis]MBF2803485.1 hypothetical protein [Enterobacter bugandensis]MCP1116251.1 hypothetical protein [Enterobacter bugandensis]MDO2434271.1 hypothetical protein [Enterobacter bugandensis]
MTELEQTRDYVKKVTTCFLGVFLFLLASVVEANPQDRAHETVERFLKWERSVKPSGIYRGKLGGGLPLLISPELLCLLESASDLRERAIREAPDEKPPFVEGNPFLPNAWERPQSSGIISSSMVPGTKISIVRVRFDYGAGTVFTGTFRVYDGAQGAKISDVDAGGACDFCQRGSLRKELYTSLQVYSGINASQCKDLAR